MLHSDQDVNLITKQEKKDSWRLKIMIGHNYSRSFVPDCCGSMFQTSHEISNCIKRDGGNAGSPNITSGWGQHSTVPCILKFAVFAPNSRPLALPTATKNSGWESRDNILNFKGMKSLKSVLISWAKPCIFIYFYLNYIVLRLFM